MLAAVLVDSVLHAKINELIVVVEISNKLICIVFISTKVARWRNQTKLRIRLGLNSAVIILASFVCNIREKLLYLHFIVNAD